MTSSEPRRKLNTWFHPSSSSVCANNDKTLQFCTLLTVASSLDFSEHFNQGICCCWIRGRTSQWWQQKSLPLEPHLKLLWLLQLQLEQRSNFSISCCFHVGSCVCCVQVLLEEPLKDQQCEALWHWEPHLPPHAPHASIAATCAGNAAMAVAATTTVWTWTSFNSLHCMLRMVNGMS